MELSTTHILNEQSHMSLKDRVNIVNLQKPQTKLTTKILSKYFKSNCIVKRNIIRTYAGTIKQNIRKEEYITAAAKKINMAQANGARILFVDETTFTS